MADPYAAYPDVDPAAQALVYGPGSVATGHPATAEQQAYVRANGGVPDPRTAGNSAQNPSYDTPDLTGKPDSYHVTPQGQLSAPAEAMNMHPAQASASGADPYASYPDAVDAAAPGAPVRDTRPTSQGLGFAQGVTTVGKNLLDTLNGSIPGLPQTIFQKVNPLTLPFKIGLNMVQGGLSTQEQTTRPGTVGKIAGEVLATAPMAEEALGAIPTGLMQGMLTSDAAGNDPLGKIRDMAAGAIGGKLGDAAMGAIGRVVMPKIRPAVQWAMDNSIRLPMGATMGGAAQAAEGMASKGTIAGPMIGAAQRQGISDFNIRTAENAAKEAGLQLPDGLAPGHEVVNALHGALSGSYDALTPNLVLKSSPDLSSAADAAREAAKGLPSAFKTRLSAIADQVAPADGSLLTGGQVQDLASHIRQEVTDAGQSGDFFAKGYGRALDNLKGAMDDGLEASNPQYADQLRGLNRGFAQSVRIERAARDAVQDGGVYTPKGLLSAIRSSDQSARDNATARGEALLQDWANSGKEVLPDKLPTSGNIWSHLPELAVTLGVGHEAGLPGIGGMLAGEGALGALYAKPAQRVITDMLTKRPDALANISRILEGVRPVVGYGTATAAPKLLPMLPALPGGVPN
jgi:hypothetical protein